MSINAADQPLWEALRALRKRLSEIAGVPAYIVFNDSTLADMLARRPKSADEMAQVAGVGEHKLERYGREFMDVIQQHPQAERAEEVMSAPAGRD